MKPTPEAQSALQAVARVSIKAQLSLEQALDVLRSPGADAHIAFSYTTGALQYLAELGAAQDLINAMRVSGRA